jgi:hypothetical protein
MIRKSLQSNEEYESIGVMHKMKTHGGRELYSRYELSRSKEPGNKKKRSWKLFRLRKEDKSVEAQNKHKNAQSPI